MLKKPIFEKAFADWSSEIPSIIKKYNNTTHNSIKTTPIQASKKTNEKLVFSNLEDKRQKQTPKLQQGQLVRTADIKRNFSKGDSTNWSYKLFRLLKSYKTQFPLMESTVYPRDIIKVYYYQQN